MIQLPTITSSKPRCQVKRIPILFTLTSTLLGCARLTMFEFWIGAEGLVSGISPKYIITSVSLQRQHPKKQLLCENRGHYNSLLHFPTAHNGQDIFEEPSALNLFHSLSRLICNQDGICSPFQHHMTLILICLFPRSLHKLPRRHCQHQPLRLILELKPPSPKSLDN